MYSEKKEFSKWWLLILMLMVLTVIVACVLNYTSVFGQRLVFKHSFQYQEAKQDEIATYESQLEEIEMKLRSDLSEEARDNLEAQASAMRIRINRARRK